MKYVVGIMLSLTGTMLLAMQKEQTRSQTASPAKGSLVVMRSQGVSVEKKELVQSNTASPARGPALPMRLQRTPADAAQPEGVLEAARSVSSGTSPDEVQSAPTSGRDSKDRRPRVISELDKANLASILKAERPAVLSNVLFTRQFSSDGVPSRGVPTERFQRAAAAASEPGANRCDSPSRSILQPVLLPSAEPETVAVSRERQSFIESHPLNLQDSALERPAICPVETYVLLQGGTKKTDTICCLNKTGQRVVVISDGQITMFDDSSEGERKKVRITRTSKSDVPITAATCDRCVFLAGSDNGLEAWEVSPTNLD